MANRLKPLILPQLLQGRISTPRKYDDVQCIVEAVEGGNDTPMFLGDNASVSDITSPATPTFSHRSGLGHLRYSSSTSSLDLPMPLPSPSQTECTSAPLAVLGLGLMTAVPPASSVTAPKRVLPNVQEEDPLEQVAEHDNLDDKLEYHHKDDSEDIEAMILAHRISDLYGCLCDEPCTHGRANQDTVSFDGQRFDYDIGFASESDMTPMSAPYAGRPRHRTNGGSMSALSEAGNEISFSSLTQRIGSQMNVLSRWRSASTSSRRAYGNLTAAPVSDPSLSHAPSSRSSSLSAARPALVDLFNPMPNPAPVIAAPSISRYGSTDSIEQFPTTTGAMDDDYNLNDVRQSIERDRTKATTPLLPPLFINTPHPSASPLPTPSVHTSPYQVASMCSSSTVADANIPTMSLSSPTSPILSHPASPITVVTPTDVRPSLLNRKLSSASFHLVHLGSNAPAVASTLEPQDEWADRLGHANQTISPRPYHLYNGAGTTELNRLCEDWAQARTNFAKHLMRMGEHYGSTSNIYELTKAKWVETECQWKAAHDEACARILPQPGSYTPPIRQHHDMSAVIPQIVDTEGKFPHRGDDEIVGPMDRVERDDVPSSEKNGMSKFLRGLAGRVRMRR
ncbi:only prolin and serin are matching in the corresponding protein [Ophiostoma piceae UAMH 11346]|uniref:Only prolin and serin are matching in the corresponding protein n=1 Tax=Ophiostoma piceae (strain UAMH 11346) TaxID=1262450 RepID=S3CQU8_OPHP1|nr:only prolin and serin are matching in the corresponding protein [Ophiostoma piceae UAMH 11346]